MTSFCVELQYTSKAAYLPVPENFATAVDIKNWINNVDGVYSKRGRDTRHKRAWTHRIVLAVRPPAHRERPLNFAGCLVGPSSAIPAVTILCSHPSASAANNTAIEALSENIGHHGPINWNRYECEECEAVLLQIDISQGEEPASPSIILRTSVSKKHRLTRSVIRCSSQQYLRSFYRRFSKLFTYSVDCRLLLFVVAECAVEELFGDIDRLKHPPLDQKPDSEIPRVTESMLKYSNLKCQCINSRGFLTWTKSFWISDDAKSDAFGILFAARFSIITTALECAKQEIKLLERSACLQHSMLIQNPNVCASCKQLNQIAFFALALIPLTTIANLLSASFLLGSQELVFSWATKLLMTFLFLYFAVCYQLGDTQINVVTLRRTVIELWNEMRASCVAWLRKVLELLETRGIEIPEQ